jgi:hypothetical protein
MDGRGLTRVRFLCNLRQIHIKFKGFRVSGQMAARRVDNGRSRLSRKRNVNAPSMLIYLLSVRESAGSVRIRSRQQSHYLDTRSS